MRLVTYRSTVEAEARLGALADGLVVDVQRLGAAAGLALPSRMLDFIDLGPVAISAVSQLLAEQARAWPSGAAIPAANVQLLAPIPRPRKNVFGIGLNYLDHVAAAAAPVGISERP